MNNEDIKKELIPLIANNEVEKIDFYLKNIEHTKCSNPSFFYNFVLLRCSVFGYLDLIKNLIDKGTFNHNSLYNSALEVAIRYEQKEVAEFLISLPNISVSTNRNSFLIQAIKKNDLDIFKLLIEHNTLHFTENSHSVLSEALGFSNKGFFDTIIEQTNYILTSDELRLISGLIAHDINLSWIKQALETEHIQKQINQFHCNLLLEKINKKLLEININSF